MKQPTPHYFQLIGLLLYGDLGPYTCWRRHATKNPVFAPKTPPKTPPTPAQTEQRAAFKAAMTSWNKLTQPQKRLWERAAQTLSLPMSGMNAYLHIHITKDHHLLTTLRKQSGIDLTYDPQ